MSDNGITTETDFFYEIISKFGIAEEDLIELNRSKRVDHKNHPKEGARQYDRLDIDYNKYLSHYFNFDSHLKCANSHSKDKD